MLAFASQLRAVDRHAEFVGMGLADSRSVHISNVTDEETHWSSQADDHSNQRPFCVAQDGSAAFFIKTGGNPAVRSGWDNGKNDKCCTSAPNTCRWYPTLQACTSLSLSVSLCLSLSLSVSLSPCRRAPLRWRLSLASRAPVAATALALHWPARSGQSAAAARAPLSTRPPAAWAPTHRSSYLQGSLSPAPRAKFCRRCFATTSERCASLALAPLPLISPYNSERSLCGTGISPHRAAGRRGCPSERSCSADRGAGLRCVRPSAEEDGGQRAAD